MYQDDENSSFNDLFVRDKSFTIHKRNIQSLGIELCIGYSAKKNSDQNQQGTKIPDITTSSYVLVLKKNCIVFSTMMVLFLATILTKFDFIR